MAGVSRLLQAVMRSSCFDLWHLMIAAVSKQRIWGGFVITKQGEVAGDICNLLRLAIFKPVGMWVLIYIHGNVQGLPLRTFTRSLH
jgi:hypothetical protein